VDNVKEKQPEAHEILAIIFNRKVEESLKRDGERFVLVSTAGCIMTFGGWTTDIVKDLDKIMVFPLYSWADTVQRNLVQSGLWRIERI
jgi:hypothetical protein